MTSMLVDSHCHIPMIEMEGGVQKIIESAREHDVGHMLCVSVDLETFPEIRALAQQNSCISASVGIHPNSRDGKEASVESLAELASDPDIVAIGETGLDYFRSNGDLEWQRERFRIHIRAAKSVNKPLIIHCREAKDDVIRVLREEAADEVGGVMHCFVEDWETAQQAMELNFLISFTGIITFKNARDLQEIARKVPMDKLLVETDSPYLTPVPFRGKTNQPAYVRYVAEQVALLKNLDYPSVVEATTDNFFELFRQAKESINSK